MRFLIFSNLFIGSCAVLMAWHTGILLYGSSPSPVLLTFIFFATLVSYSFHWLLTQWDQLPLLPGEVVNTGTFSGTVSSRLTWMATHRYVHPALLILASVAAAFAAVPLRDDWKWLLLLSFVTFLYSAPKIPFSLFRLLRRVAIGKTIFLSLVWTLVTVTLPQVSMEHHQRVQPTDLTALLLFITRFGLIYAICILFDLRDVSDDRAVGIRSLITWLTPAEIRRLYYLMLIVSLVASLSLLLTGASSWQVLTLCVPVIIAGCIFRRASTSRSDMYFYGWLDGLMAGSALLALLAEAFRYIADLSAR